MQKFIACLLTCFVASAGAQISGPPYNPAAVAITGGAISGISTLGVTGLVTANGGLRFAPRLVAALPTCNAGAQGNLFVVSDALTPAYGITLVGGGAVAALALCDGTNWMAH